MAETRDRLHPRALAARVGVAVAALVLGVAAFAGLYAVRPTPPTSDRADQPQPLEVIAARAVPVRRRWIGYGTAEAMDSADVPARVTATVARLPDDVLVGAPVEAGQLLAQLDDSDFLRQEEIAEQTLRDLDAQLAQLEVDRARWERRVELLAEERTIAERDLERVRDAVERQVANERELDDARRALLGAERALETARQELERLGPRRRQLEAVRAREEASLRLARLSVERSRITSPIAGTLQSVDVEIGESLQPGARVARVVSLARVEVPLLLPSSARAHVAIDDEVTLGGGSAGPRWTASITRIAPEDDPVTRTFAAYVEVAQDPRDPGRLAPGRFVQGEVVSRIARERFVVPRRSVLSERILLIEDGHVASQRVEADFQVEATFPELGVPDAQWVVLAEPLPDGAHVVVNASPSLIDGLPATPVVALPDTAMRGATP